MAKPLPMVVVVVITSLFLLLTATPSTGFAIKNPLPNLLQQFTTTAAPPPKNPEALLQEINLNLDPPLLPQIPALLSASLVTLLRGGSGIWASGYRLQWIFKTNDDEYSYVRLDGLGQLRETSNSKSPATPLKLYEFESDAACRLVREACSMLSLTVTFFPTPENAPHYRDDIVDKFPGFPANDFPYLYDPNTSVRLSGYSNILEYLFTSYGEGKNKNNIGQPIVPSSLLQSSDWPLWTAAVGLKALRLNAGGRYQPSRFDYNDSTPGSGGNSSNQPLKLWAYEGSPFCKLVREKLSALELPHTCVYTPRGSANRQVLYEQCGERFQVPYLEDPNTGVQLFESAVICEYLDKCYGLAKPKGQI